jgi:hypothetical protein
MTALVLIVLVLVAGAAVYVWAIGRVRVPTGLSSCQ